MVLPGVLSDFEELVSDFPNCCREDNENFFWLLESFDHSFIFQVSKDGLSNIELRSWSSVPPECLSKIQAYISWFRWIFA